MTNAELLKNLMSIGNAESTDIKLSDALKSQGITPDCKIYAGAVDNLRNALSDKDRLGRSFYEEYCLYLCNAIGEAERAGNTHTAKILRESRQVVSAVICLLKDEVPKR